MKHFSAFPVLFLSLLPLEYLSARPPIAREGISSIASQNSLNELSINVSANKISNTQEALYSYSTLSNGTVRLTAQNTTGAQIVGDIIREGPVSGEIINEFMVPAGGTFVFIDDDVLPGITYLYVFEYFIEGVPLPVINLDYITPVATMPALAILTLQPRHNMKL